MGRRWLLWLLLLAVAVVVITRFTDLRTLAATLSAGRWPWLVAAVALQLAYFVLYAAFYQLGFATVEVRSRVRELLPVFLASYFVNAVAPSGGAGAAALFVDDAVRRGESGARAAAGTVFVLAADLVTLIPFLGYGMYYLQDRNALHYYDVAGAVIFVMFSGGVSMALFLAWWQRRRLQNLLAWLEHVVNRVGSWFRRPHLMAEEWPRRTAEELAYASAAIVRHPDRLGRTLALGVLLHVVSLAGLFALFLAYYQAVSISTLVAGFSLGVVFFVVTIVPEGVGAVEGIMGLVFVSLGVPSARAIAIILVFRGLNFFLPLFVGFLLMRRVRAFGGGTSGQAPAGGA